MPPDTITGRRGRDARVGVLQRFERRLGGLVEGAFAKVFKGDVQPVEIAGALQREADDRKTVVGEGRVAGAQRLRRRARRSDHERLHHGPSPSATSWPAWSAEHAAEQRYTFVGPVAVKLELVDGRRHRRRSASAAGSRPATSSTAGGWSPPRAGERPRPPAAPRRCPARPPPPRARCRGQGRPGTRVARGEERRPSSPRSVTVIGRGGGGATCGSTTRASPAGTRRSGWRTAATSWSTWARPTACCSTQARSRAASCDSDRLELGSTTLVFRVDQD